MGPAVVPISGDGWPCTVKNLEPGMTREQQKLIQKGDQLEINPAENGWELNIRKKLQTQQHLSPKFPTLLS